MAGGLLVLDTSVLIDHVRDRPAAVSYLRSLIPLGLARVHPACAAELLAGVGDRDDLRASIAFLGVFPRLSVKPIDFELCLQLVARHKLSSGIGWPDCLIAATCLRLGLPIVTLNDRHFRVVAGLRVVRPY